MEASIVEPNIRRFIRVLQCAAKFGDDLSIRAARLGWEMAVHNSSKTAYCHFTLSPDFFSKYKIDGTPAQQREGIKCMLHVKSMLNVLGRTTSITNVNRIDLKINDPDRFLRFARTQSRNETEDEAPGEISSMLEMKLLCEHGVIKRHSLHLGTTPFQRVDVDPASTPSGFTVESSQLSQWLDHFTSAAMIPNNRQDPRPGSKGENSLGWSFSEGDVRVKTWEGSAVGDRKLSTEIKLDSKDFHDYEVVGSKVDLTLPMREFRAALSLAEQLNIDITISFSQPTQPLTLASIFTGADDQDILNIFCAIATTSCNAFDDLPPANRAANPIPRQERAASHQSEHPSTNGNGKRNAPSSFSSRKRSSLTFTPDAPIEKRPAVVYNSQPSQSQEAGEEPLFLPGSQGVQMSQEEAMSQAGFAEEDPEDLLLAMDDAGMEDLEGESGDTTLEGDSEEKENAQPGQTSQYDGPKRGDQSKGSQLFQPEPGIFHGPTEPQNEEEQQEFMEEQDELNSDDEELPSSGVGGFTPLFRD